MIGFRKKRTEPMPMPIQDRHYHYVADRHVLAAAIEAGPSGHLARLRIAGVTHIPNDLTTWWLTASLGASALLGWMLATTLSR